MSKKLINKDKAYEIYFELGTSRSLSKLHDHLSKKYPKISPSYPTLKNWSKNDNWVERCLIRDKEISQGRDAGVEPSSTRDMMAAIKEARSIMGETDSVKIEATVAHHIVDDPDVLKSANELAQKLSRK